GFCPTALPASLSAILAQSSSRRRCACLICRFTSVRRCATVRMWALAASAVPGATASGFCRNSGSTSAAVIRRMRCFLRMRSTVVSRRAGGLGRGRCRGPQLEEPIGGEIITDRERLRIIPPELLAHSVGEPVSLLLQVLGHARPFAQLDDH